MIPIDHQPPGYWATNLYTSPRKRPKSEAPIKDLPPRAAQRFKKAREGLRALKHVTEQVVFMGTAWKWVWMYEVGGRKLGYLHPMEAGVSGTFVLSEAEEREFAVGAGVPKALRQAIRDVAVASGVRWGWMAGPDLAPQLASSPTRGNLPVPVSRSSFVTTSTPARTRSPACIVTARSPCRVSPESPRSRRASAATR